MKTLNRIIRFFNKYLIEQFWDTTRKALIISLIPLALKLTDVLMFLNPAALTPEKIGSLYKATMVIHNSIGWVWGFIGNLVLIVFIISVIPIVIRELLIPPRN